MLSLFECWEYLLVATGYHRLGQHDTLGSSPHRIHVAFFFNSAFCHYSL